VAELILKTFNVKGIDDYTKRQEIFMWCKEQNPDILFLQETHSCKNKSKTWKREWGSDIIFSHGESNARGVCICFNKNLNYNIIAQKRDKWGRIIVLDIQIGEIRMTLANLYAPNDDLPEFFNQVFEMIREFDNEYIVLGGDFNLVFNVDIDKKGGRPVTHEKSKLCLLGWMEELDLVDIWRKKNPSKFKYTWRSYRKPFIYCRLDFFLVSFSLTSIIKKIEITPGFRSDHHVVTNIIKFDNENRGPGFWKLNCSLLDNQDYINEIVECINNCETDNPGTGDTLLWETMKCRIRGTSVKFSSNLKRTKNKLKKDLNCSLIDLKDKLPTLTEVEEINNCAMDIEIIENKLENIIKKEAEGFKIRSKTQMYEQGEKSTRYFHSLEKKNQENKNIKLLEKDDGEIITGTKNILQEEVNFYQDLYESKTDTSKDDFREYFSDIKLEVDPNITDIKDKINEEELFVIIESFSCNKSPGSDGLPIEFYKKILDSY